MRHEPCELVEHLVAAQKLARLRGQRLVRTQAPEERHQRLETGGEMEVEVPAVEDECTDRAQVEPAPPPAPEPVGRDEFVALPPLDASCAGREARAGQDARQSRTEIEGGCQVEDEGVVERRACRCFERLSKRGHCAPTVARHITEVIPALRRVAGRRTGESTVVLAALRSRARSATVKT
jgi:hypothetical protein